MPNVTITSLPQALPLTGTEAVPIVQGGQTRQTTTGAIANAPVLNQTFLTLVQEPTLPNSRYLSTGIGLGLVDNGSQSYLRLTLNGTSGSLETALDGVVVKSSGIIVSRTIQSGSDGISIVNGNGTAGNPQISLTGPVLTLASLASTGMLSIGGGSVNARVLTGTTDEIDITDGNGTNNPTFRLASNAVLPGTGAVRIPVGTTAQRPSGVNGQIRYNTDTNAFEVYENSSWSNLPAGAVTLINTGTGLTGGPITTTGTISIDSTVVTLTGSQVLTNKSISGSTNTLSNIANASLTNSSVTYNGVTVALGASGTITAATPNALTVSTGLQLNSGTTFDGSAAKTISIDSTVVTLSGSQTLTNKTLTLPIISQISNTGTLTLPTSTDTLVARDTSDTLTNKSISGSSNTLSNIGNASLTNSSVTYNGVSVALGASGTITANTTNSLTAGTGLQMDSGTTFNGSAARTISIDSTVATLTGSQVLTNKSISGSTNTLTNIGNGSLTNSTISFTYSGGISGSASVALGSSNALSLSNIPNSSLQNSAVTVGTTSISLGSSSLTLAGLTSVTVTQAPTTALQLATKQYVDDAVSSGIDIHSPVRVESPSALNASYTPGGTAVTVTDITGTDTLTFSSSPSLSVNDQIVFSSSSNGIVSGTAYYVFSAPAANQVTLSLSYNGPKTTFTNGTGLTIAGLVNAGVGATLTNAGTKAALQIDGVNLSVGNRVLVYNQSNAFENGVYTVTTVGTPDPGGTNWVLTRATNEDKYQPDSTTGLGQGDYFFVQEGSTGAGESYVLTTVNPLIIGTTNLTFTQFSASQVYSAGTGLTLSGTQFSLTSPVTAQLGGTGQTSYTAGDLLTATATTTLSKLALGTQGYVLTAGATGPTWSGISGGTF